MNLFVTAQSIRNWSDALDARSVLPHVVRRLVTATANAILEIDFPAYESVQRPGFDGIVECAGGTAWVPNGRSVWELSTETSVRSKANEDFEKRTKETPQDEQEGTFYVCLTSRRFNKKREWAQEKDDDENNFWLGVRAFDADDLEQWTESAPAGVGAWFGRQLGTRPSGVDDVAQHWSAVSKAATCALQPSVFLAGREQSVERIHQWLDAGPARLAIDCRSPGEVIDFFCAAVAAMDEGDRIATESRSIIVHEHEAWITLRDSTAPAVLIVAPSVLLSNEEIGRAVTNQHHVLVATEPTILTGQRDLELERAGEFELTKALEESGYSPAKAEQFARAAGGSLAILKQRLVPAGFKCTPGWASSVSPDVIAACLLLGGWESNESDQHVFGEVAGCDYASCESDLQRMANAQEPLLLHAAGNWRLISKDHAWSLFEDRVTPSALNVFDSLAVEILVDDDPRYDLPEEKRFYANIEGHVPRYSGTVKKHVAETLAFLGEFGPRFVAASSINIGATIDRIVASVLSPTCTWHRWASLGSSLPLLAEASPISFLSAIRDDLNQTQPELAKLLNEEEESPFLGRCNHAGLLWALEGLAWPTSHLGEVAEILLALADRDAPESRWSNRPKNSLTEILSYWMPQTTATVDERIQILDLLIRCNREAAWPILMGLLPESTGGVSTPTHKPYWRGWADEWSRGATRNESMAFITATAERVIQQAGVEPARWQSIFAKIGRFPYTVRKQLLQAAAAFSCGEIRDTDRRALSEELSQQINRHRHFNDATWSLPSEILDELDSVLEQLKPQNCVLRNAWLFEQWPDRFFESGGDHGDNQTALDEARKNAICEILDSEDFEGVDSLVQHAESPNEVGRALAMVTGDEYLRKLVPSRLEGEQRDFEFAGGFIWNRYWPNDWQWVDEALALCQTDDAKANFLRALRFSPEVWSRAIGAGGTVDVLYWDRCSAFNPDLESVDISTAVRNLCQQGRPLAAIDLLSMAIHKNRDLDLDTLLSPLETLLTLPAEQAKSQRGQSDSYHIQEIIAALQNRDDVDEARLIPIEWHYIRLLDGHSKQAPKTLQKHLSSSPEFFHEVLSQCYRSRNEDNNNADQEPSANQRYMAEHAFHLLHEWDRLPGSRDDGSVDENALRQWCVETRHLAEESGRLGVCDDHIGQLFARSKHEDDDGTWPCSAVRAVAGEIGTDSLGSGMSCGIRNLRGACFRGSGGNQERNLATTFQGRADRIRFDSPFVARILDSVVQSYESEAEWWDERDRWED
jgi:hypothetical protein